MIKIFFSLLSAFAVAVSLGASPLTAPTAVHTQPFDNAAVLKVLAPSTIPEAAGINVQATTPAGWMAVMVPGPFEAYVQNNDIDKGLHVKTGSALHLEPAVTSGKLGTMEAGDKTTITGLHGKWTQINLSKSVVGYIRVSNLSSSQNNAPQLTNIPAASTAATPQTVTPPAVQSGPAPQRVAPIGPASTFGNADGAIMPRYFQGKLVSTRRPFAPRRPYDWQLNDAAGVRYAYLDTSKLLLTAQILDFADHEVVVYGAPKALPDGKNIVIQAENLRLK
ncbi:MAG: SH3 domain-containing protein [Cephaloticoccus sp.]|nr:SH3 domain-containing protein [Cephaloticoccus sp.]MCF7759771.1 SH3 domain-containing protein [Cephaloticoccus sp.]